MALTLLGGGTALLESGWSRADVWLTPGGVAGIGAPSSDPGLPDALGEVQRIDASGLRIIPGLIDGHLHLLGGGGGGGYETRIPELPADAALEAGITSCVAMPGVDNVTRSLEALLATARGFTRRGVRALAMTGGFMWPPRTLTGSVRDDLSLIPDLVGVKIALGEHLATAPDARELARVLRELGWVSKMSASACLLHVHLGVSPDPGRALVEALDEAGSDPAGVVVTHANYAASALDAAIELGRAGCWIDVNPLLHPGRVAASIAPADAIRTLREAGVPAERLTMSTDGNASVPRILPDGTLERFSHQLGLLPAAREVARQGVLDEASALALITRNPADALRRPELGRIEAGAASDLVLIDEDWRIDTVISSGVVRVRDGVAVSPSPFRDPRWGRS